MAIYILLSIVLHGISHDGGSIPDRSLAVRSGYGPWKLVVKSLHYHIDVHLQSSEDWLACLLRPIQAVSTIHSYWVETYEILIDVSTCRKSGLVRIHDVI